MLLLCVLVLLSLSWSLSLASRRATSNHIPSQHVTARHGRGHHVTSRQVKPLDIASRRVASSPVTSSHTTTPACDADMGLDDMSRLSEPLRLTPPNPDTYSHGSTYVYATHVSDCLHVLRQTLKLLHLGEMPRTPGEGPSKNCQVLGPA